MCPLSFSIRIPNTWGTVAKFGQVPGVGANGIRPIRRPSWGRMIAWPGIWGGECHSPLHGRQKMNRGLHPKNRLGTRNLGGFRLRKRMGRMVCTPTEIRTTRGWAFCRGTEIKTTCGWAFRRGTEIKTTRGWAFRRGTEIKTTRGWAFRRGTEIKTTRGWDLRRCTGE